MSLQIGDPYIHDGNPHTIAAVISYPAAYILDNGRTVWL